MTAKYTQAAHHSNMAGVYFSRLLACIALWYGLFSSILFLSANCQIYDSLLSVHTRDNWMFVGYYDSV